MRYVKTFESHSQRDVLVDMLSAMARFGSGMRQKLYQARLDSLKEVSCVPIETAIGSDALEKLKKRVKLEPKGCYGNAYHVAECLHDMDVKYCEGYMLIKGIPVPIEHAFNKIGDSYFDATAELVLGDDVTETEYYVIGEWDADTALRWMASGDSQCYGEVFDKEFFDTHKENVKKQ